MTMLFDESVRCALCGTVSEHAIVGTTNAFGSSDLDTRPPEMQRSTIDTWVQCCPGCGACAEDLSKLDQRAGDVVNTAEYTAQRTHADFPELANAFICKSIIDDHLGKLALATWALIHTAWVCDDADLNGQSIICRRRAGTMLQKATANNQMIIEQPGAGTVILIDLLRRAGELEEAARIAEQTRDFFSEEILTQIVDYQKALIKAGDLHCHTIDDAFRL